MARKPYSAPAVLRSAPTGPAGYDTAANIALGVATYGGLVGLVLRQIRERKGLRQGDVAQRLDVSQSMLSRMEAGRQRLDVVMLTRWAEALGTKASAVLAAVVEAESKAG